MRPYEINVIVHDSNVAAWLALAGSFMLALASLAGAVWSARRIAHSQLEAVDRQHLGTERVRAARSLARAARDLTRDASSAARGLGDSLVLPRTTFDGRDAAEKVNMAQRDFLEAALDASLFFEEDILAPVSKLTDLCSELAERIQAVDRSERPFEAEAIAQELSASEAAIRRALRNALAGESL